MTKPADKQVRLEWQGTGLEFRGEGKGRAPISVDSDNTRAPGPMELLLIALAGCTASDIVPVLEKKRLKVDRLAIDVTGQRREEHPQRYVAIQLRYTVVAPGATEAAVRQAIDLSLQKYCSVTHSLNPDIPISYELALQA